MTGGSCWAAGMAAGVGGDLSRSSRWGVVCRRDFLSRWRSRIRCHCPGCNLINYQLFRVQYDLTHRIAFSTSVRCAARICSFDDVGSDSVRIVIDHPGFGRNSVYQSLLRDTSSLCKAARQKAFSTCHWCWTCRFVGNGSVLRICGKSPTAGCVVHGLWSPSRSPLRMPQRVAPVILLTVAFFKIITTSFDDQFGWVGRCLWSARWSSEDVWGELSANCSPNTGPNGGRFNRKVTLLWEWRVSLLASHTLPSRPSSWFRK